MDQSTAVSEAPAMFLYLDSQGQTKGPMPAAVLLKMLRKGVVSGHTMVWTTGMAEWASMREVEPFRGEAVLEGLSWYYIDAESGQQTGPVPSRLLIHYMEEGKVDGLTMIFHQQRNSWLQLGEVPELKQVMQQLAEEEDMRVALANPVAESDQIYVDSDGEQIPAIPVDMKEKGLSTNAGVAKRSFTADDGKHFVWDDAENDWVEDENPSGSDDSDDEGAEGKMRPARPAAADSQGGTEDAGGGGEGTEEEKAATRKRKRKNKKKAPSWKDNASGLWVYVTGLPVDVTAEELKAHFSKVGLIAISPLDQQPKIKIYRNEDGSVKGDCSICFNAPESVEMALELLDGGYLRIGSQISVTKAQFQKKEGLGDEDGSSDVKRARSNISHAQIKVAQSINKQALTWNEDDDLGVSKKKALKIIVLEGMFAVDEAQSDAFMAELEVDIVSECEKCGPIEKITVFSKNPRGIVIVKFATAFAAQECVRILDGRFFGGRKVKAYFWDGSTDYSVPLSAAQAAAAEAEEQRRLQEFGDWLDREQEELPEELQLRVEK